MDRDGTAASGPGAAQPPYAALSGLKKTSYLSARLFGEGVRVLPPEGYLPMVLTHAPPSVRPEFAELSPESAVTILKRLRAPFAVLPSREAKQEYYDLLLATVNNTSLPLEDLENFAKDVAIHLADLTHEQRTEAWDEMSTDFYESDFSKHFLYHGICKR